MSVILPTIGESNATAAPKINKALVGLNSQVGLRAGSNGRGLITGIGDSEISYWLGNQDAGYNISLASAFHHVIAARYNADIEINSQSGQYNFGAAGRNSAYILATVVPQMRDYLAAGNRIPDLTIIHAGQNDGVVRMDIAQAALNNVKQIAIEVLAMGVPEVIVVGPIPDPKIKGPDRPYALDWFNRQLMLWAAKTPGCIPMEVMSLVKDITGVPESLGDNAAVWWRQGIDATGAVTPRVGLREQTGLGGRGSTAVDNEHLAMLFGEIIAERRLEAILRRRFREFQMPDIASVDWRAPASGITNNNPSGNYLGKRGLNYGTGGTINGSASEGTATAWKLEYNAADGVTVTPSIFIDIDGRRRQRLTWSGTPTGDGLVTLTTTMTAAADQGEYALAGMMQRRALDGVAGYSLNGAGLNIGSAGALSEIPLNPVSDIRVVRSLRNASYSNTFNQKDFRWSWGYVSGIQTSGSVEVWDTSFMREV